jgi:nucleotide-binding universal stress UspA family protein
LTCPFIGIVVVMNSVSSSLAAPYIVMMIVPTGIGAAIGGFAGDALPVARAIAHVADRLITHPNVLNGAQLYWPLPNALYVEGYGLDRFAAGQWGLRPVTQNRIGIVLDQGIEPELRVRHLQAADAARATLGLSITDYVVTDTPLGVSLQTASSGATWGTIQHPDSLLRAVDTLIHQAKAEAIAVIARFPDDEGSEALQQYRQGQGVDALAGAEAVISHLVVRTFRVPCAHAPALQPLPLDPVISPRSAAEELGYTFLPCVLVGLSRAPQFTLEPSASPSVIWAHQVNALVVPATAMGGSAVLSLSQTGTLILGVGDNTTTLNVTAEMLGVPAFQVNSYLEAIGVLVAHRAGLHPAALSPNIYPIQPCKPSTADN